MSDDWDPRDDRAALAAPPEHLEGIEALAEFLVTDAGALALAWLRASVLDVTISPMLPDAALRQHEGRRELVLKFHRMA